LLIPVLAIRNGKPIAVIRVYAFAYGSTSGVAPKNLSIGVRNMVVIRNKNIPIIAIRIIPLPAYFSDSFFSPAPRCSE